MEPFFDPNPSSHLLESLKNHKKGLIGFFIILIVGFSVWGVMKGMKQQEKVREPQEVASSNPFLKEEPPKEEPVCPEPSSFYIDIKGAVAHPGVYSLEEGSRIREAITKAGGLTEQADTSLINLSKRLKDEMIITIPTKEEVEKTIGKEENPYNKEEDPFIKDECDCEEEVTIPGKISLNKATLAELDRLPGIGPSKAQDILNYREEHGAFTSVEDLKKVKGIGDAIFNELKDKVEL